MPYSTEKGDRASEGRRRNVGRGELQFRFRNPVEYYYTHKTEHFEAEAKIGSA
jgi:hypothetical protein